MSKTHHSNCQCSYCWMALGAAKVGHPERSQSEQFSRIGRCSPEDTKEAGNVNGTVDTTLSFTEAMDIHRQDKAARFEWDFGQGWEPYDPEAEHYPPSLASARYRLIPKKSRAMAIVEADSYASLWSQEIKLAAARCIETGWREAAELLRTEGFEEPPSLVERHFLGGG